MIGHPHRLLLAGPGWHRARDEAQRFGTNGPELKMNTGRDGQRGSRLDVDDDLVVTLPAPDLSIAGSDIPDLFHCPVSDG